MFKKSVGFFSQFIPTLAAGMTLCSVLFPLSAQAAFFDWFETLSPKAKRAKDLLETFDPIVEQSLKDFQVPGLAIGIVADGQIVYAKGYGFRDVEKKLPVSADTLFGIGSCTKAFTAFAIGNLIDEGLLSWDQNVSDLLPEFRLCDQYATQNLKIRDLLTHRSGMPRHDWMWYNSQMSPQELLRRIRYLEPSADIRERYQYGSLMYFVAGCAMERISGKKWNELISEHILSPLKMHRTNFSIPEMEKSDDYAHPYFEKNDRLKKMTLRDISLIGPGGSMNSSASEMTRWLQLQVEGGVFADRALISPVTLQEMHAPQVIIPGAPESKESQLYAYGIGWTVLSYRGHYYLSHDGARDGYTSLVGILPSQKIGIVILTNKNMTSLPRYLSFQLLDRLLEMPLINWLGEGVEGINKGKESMRTKKTNEDHNRKKGTAPSHSLEEYAGEYEHPGYGKLLLEVVDGKLQATYNGIRSIWDHWHYDIFTISEELDDLIVSLEGSKIAFKNNVNGDIESVSIPYEPQSPDIVFKKKPADKLSTLSYLRQFVGPYEIYGYTVEIIVRDQALFAVIPGQPLYELVPNGENEFSVKAMTSSTVRFVMDKDNCVEEVLLIQPYGAFSATPKRH